MSLLEPVIYKINDKGQCIDIRCIERNRKIVQIIVFLCVHVCEYLCVHVHLVTRSCPILCDHLDYSLPGSSVHGILQARLLEWVVISSSNLSDPRIEPKSPESPALASGFLTF